jgi:hypothetical protein
LVDLFEFEIGLLLIFRKLGSNNALNCVQEESGCLSSNYKQHKTEMYLILSCLSILQ